MPTRREDGRRDWIDSDEFPDERDVDDFGDDSPPDNDPLTIGYARRGLFGEPVNRPPFWTPRRILYLVIGLLVIAALLLPTLLSLFR